MAFNMDMMTSSNGNIFALLALCEKNPPVTGGFPSQRPVTRSLEVFFDLRLNKLLSKQPDAGDLRRYGAHYDFTVMCFLDTKVPSNNECLYEELFV